MLCTKLSEIVSFIDKASSVNFIGVKSLDFKDFCSMIDIYKSKEHLTQKGMNKISILSKGMNTGRTKFN